MQQRFLFAMAAGAVAKRVVSPDTLPMLFKDTPLLKDLAPILLANPSVVAGVLVEVACEPDEAYDSVIKYVKAGFAGYMGQIIVQNVYRDVKVSYA